MKKVQAFLQRFTILILLLGYSVGPTNLVAMALEESQSTSQSVESSSEISQNKKEQESSSSVESSEEKLAKFEGESSVNDVESQSEKNQHHLMLRKKKFPFKY